MEQKGRVYIGREAYRHGAKPGGGTNLCAVHRNTSRQWAALGRGGKEEGARKGLLPIPTTLSCRILPRLLLGLARQGELNVHIG